MKYRIRYTGQFKRDMRLCQRRGYDMGLLHTVITLLAEIPLLHMLDIANIFSF